jgi:hypothetical protein
MTSAYVGSWAFAFAVTLLIELPIVLRVLRPSGLPTSTLFAICLIANLTTHPVVWFVFPFLGLGTVGAFLLSEVWAFGLEIWVYDAAVRSVSKRRSIAASVAANLASATLYPLVSLIASRA